VKTIYLSLGSNIGDRETHLKAALDRLPEAGVTVLRVSPIYETEPVDGAEGRWFLNLVAEAETEVFPLQLLSRLQRLERALGRVRRVVNGPRTIDIDILMYGQTVMQRPELEIPHPRMTERRFVLVPLADLAPELRHPVTRRTVRDLLEAAPSQVVRARQEISGG
jgi:2-amino-4-hydroxy-6-hydroxymethyldihydropteridine diphosphokinase